MKQILAPVFALSLFVAPVYAQGPEPEEGFDLIEEGAQILLRGLLSEMAPAINEFEDLADEYGPKMLRFTQEIGPGFADLIAQMDDLSFYEAPEFLPNGDVIMRRRDDAPRFRPEIAPDSVPDIEL